MSTYASLTVAQYRLLGRALRGEALPLDRYRLQNPTVRALVRKGCLLLVAWGATIDAAGAVVTDPRKLWHPTLVGHEKHLAGGRPGRLTVANGGA